MQKTFIVYNDPSHGWAKVPISLLSDMGLINKITTCSYQRGKFAYLEEDADLTLFMKEFRNQFKIEPKFKDMYSDKQSKIRSYAYFKA